MTVTANFTGPVQTDAINRFRMLQSMARSHISASPQSINNATITALAFDANDFNTDSMWSGGANTRFTAPVTGKYLVMGGAQFAPNATGHREIAVRKNGSSYFSDVIIQAVSDTVTDVTLNDIVALTASDYIEIMVSQNSGGALNVNNAMTSFGAMLYIGE